MEVVSPSSEVVGLHHRRSLWPSGDVHAGVSSLEVAEVWVGNVVVEFVKGKIIGGDENKGKKG